MKRIRQTDEYAKWLKKLKDSQARYRVNTRVIRLAEGNPGEVRFLGKISELKIDYGPGYRVYYRDTGKEIIILLCGGDKTTQQADIERAKRLAKQYEEETNHGTN
jgi:putative addiction module killer protein